MSKPKKKKAKPDDFASVAKRLGCDPSMENFDAKLGKIVKTNVTKPSVTSNRKKREKA